MPGNNNNDTTTKFKVDISELKKAMQEAKRSIAVTNSEFKAIASSMDDWSKSTDGISAKLKQLDSNLNSQKTILANLENQYALTVQEMGEGSKAADDLKIKINNQKAVINNTEKEINKWKNSLEEVTNESKQVETATESLSNTINKQQSDLNELKAKYSNLVLEQGDASTEAKQLSSQITKLSSELNENKSKLNSASSAADDLDQSLDNASDGADKAESGFTVLKGTIANLAAQAITKAVDALKEFITQANEVDKAVNGLQTSTGATAKEMKQYESVMKDIYNGNYGESYDDVADSMSQVLQTMGKLNKTDLKNITTNGLALRDTFGFEMPESMRAVNSLMKQFGISADEAYNLIAQGAQNGLNQNDDLLDVINEYAVQFKNSGYSANDMFNMLKNGADSGVWSVDKLGDAVKEMNIRFSDGTVKDALEENAKALGLSKKEIKNLQTEYNKGGDSAQNAVGKMIDSILSVKDETKQYQLGVSVFGTMWEDLGAEAIKSLMSTKGELNSTKQTMDEIKKTKYDDLGSSLSQLGRMFKEEILAPVKDHIMPKLQEFVGYIIQNFPSIVQACKDVVNTLKEWIPTLQVIGSAIASYLIATKILAFVEAIKNGTVALKLMSAAQTALNAVMSLNPIGLVVAAIAALVAAFVILWNKSDAFRNFWINLWENVKTVTKTVIDAIGTFFTETVPTFFSNLVTKTKEFVDNVVNFFKELPSKISEWLTNALTKVGEWAVNMANKAKETGSNFLNKVIEFFNQLPYLIGYAIGAALGKILSWGVNLYNFAKTEIPKFINKIIEFFKQLPSKIWTWLVNTLNKIITWRNNMVNKAKEVGSNFINKVIEFFKQLPSKIWTWLTNTIAKVTTWSTNMASKAKTTATNFVNNVVNFIKNLPSKIWTWLVNAANKVVTWGSDLASKGKAAAKKLFDAVVNKVKEIPGKLKSIGSDIVKGLWNGINDMTGWVIGKIKGFGKGITDGLKDYFKIKSPSRLMRDEVGKNIALGVIEGIKRQKKYAKTTTTELAEIILEAAKTKLDKYKTYNDMSLAQEVAYWNEIRKTIKSGTSARLEADKEYLSKKQQLNEQVLAADEKYQQNTADVYDKLMSDIDAVTKKYEDSISNRVDKITSSLDLFKAFQLDEAISKEDLANNLMSQVNALAEWDNVLDRLASREGMSADLLDELESMGVSSLETLKQLNSMSNEELKAYIELYDLKKVIASERARKENEELKQQSQQQISELITEASKKMDELKKTYEIELKELGAVAKDSAVDIGVSIVNGIKQGIAEQKTILDSYINQFMKSALNTAQQALGISAMQNTAVSGIGAAVSGLTTASPIASESSGGVVNNFTQIINSPTEVNRLDVYRNTKNLLGYAGGAS